MEDFAMTCFARFAFDPRRFLRLAGMVALCLSMLTPMGGCSPSQTIGAGEIDTTALGHTSFIAGGESITAHNVDGTGHYGLNDADGMEVYSNLPGMQASIGASGAFLFSPRDASLASGTLRLYDDATGELIMELDFAGLNANVSSAIAADAESVAQLAEYARSLSADEREKFISAVESLAPMAAEALRAALGG
jgi:hypothetical protein